MLTLHGYWSTNPMKVRLALAEADVQYTFVEVELGKRANRTPEYLALHPRGQVPVLVDDGVPIWESGACLLWIAERSGKLLAASGAGRARALSLLFFESAAFQHAAEPFFRERALVPHFNMPPKPEALEAAHKPMGRHLDLLEAQLGDGPFLVGDLSIADLAFAPWLPVLDLGERPRVRAWFDRLRTRPSWTSLAWAYGAQP